MVNGVIERLLQIVVGRRRGYAKRITDYSFFSRTLLSGEKDYRLQITVFFRVPILSRQSGSAQGCTVGLAADAMPLKRVRRVS